MNISVKLLNYNPASAKNAELAGRISYGSYDKYTTTEVDAEYIGRMIKRGHTNVLEHTSFTFLIYCSRVTSHQMVRHRFFSFTQESQRYVEYDNLPILKPEELPEELEPEYQEAAAKIQQVVKDFREAIQAKGYELHRETVRYLYPNATRTRFMLTTNARALFNFFDLRICNRAQTETRRVAMLMYKEVLRVAPEIFQWWRPRCWGRNCPELSYCRKLDMGGKLGVIRREQLEGIGIIQEGEILKLVNPETENEP